MIQGPFAPHSMLRWLVLLLFLMSGLYADGLTDILTRGRLKVGVKAHAAPFSIMNEKGEMEGFDVGIAKALASCLEVELDLVPITSAERIPALKEGRVDLVIATMTTTRRREREVDFSTPYFQDGQSLLCLSTSDVKSYQDLGGKKVGAIKGTTSLKNITMVAPDAEVVAFDSASKVLEALEAGEVDAFSSDMMMLMGHKLRSKDRTQLQLRGGKFTVEPYGVAMRENESNLRNTIDEAIMDMWKSGTWKSIYEKWFGRRSPYYHENNFEVKSYH